MKKKKYALFFSNDQWRAVLLVQLVTESELHVHCDAVIGVSAATPTGEKTIQAHMDRMREKPEGSYKKEKWSGSDRHIKELEINLSVCWIQA